MKNILVTVGTDYHLFNRLIKWVDQWIINSNLEVNVYVQHGTSISSKNANYSINYFTRSELVCLLYTSDAADE